jgi:aspartate kinase
MLIAREARGRVIAGFTRLGGGAVALVVQKFGGTSVADLDRIRAVARRVKSARQAGDRLAVVVSAMAGTTDQLIQWVTEIGGVQHDRAEHDVVVASGEQITSGLLALALQAIGVPARSFMGWQMPLETDAGHSRARIRTLDATALRACLAQGQVAIAAGFQGVAPGQRISTLGRGGSDTSAVALAAALGADRCDIYTDVDGVYTTDPRIVGKARKLERVTYEEMLEMASQGAKVLQTRSVALAMQHGVRIQVLSSFDERPGTLVVDESEIVEQQVVSGIAYSRDEAKVTLVGVADRPGVAATIFGPLAEAGINVDMIVQNVSADGETTDLTFTVGRADLARTLATLEAMRAQLGCRRIDADAEVVKISVIGVGMRSHAGIAHVMFRTLAERGINIQAISTSEIKISILIDEAYTELALRALHTAYGLDAA